MATTTTLEFEEYGDAWRAQYVSHGDTVVQLTREGPGKVAVYANISGMPETPVGTWTGYEAGQYVIFNAAIPAGLSVTIISGSKVTAAKALTQED